MHLLKQRFHNLWKIQIVINGDEVEIGFVYRFIVSAQPVVVTNINDLAVGKGVFLAILEQILYNIQNALWAYQRKRR